MKNVLWAPDVRNLTLLAYKDLQAPPCNAGPAGWGADPCFFWPCSANAVDGVYVTSASFEDETHVDNHTCTAPTRSINPRSDGPTCFDIYQWVSNMPSYYKDTVIADPGTTYQPTVGSAKAWAFNPSTLYFNYMYFAANVYNNVVGTEATHEFEIGTTRPGSLVRALLCVQDEREGSRSRSIRTL